MPINRLLKNGAYSPDQIIILNQAFDLALRSLSLVDRNDRLCEIVARAIIAIGLDGTSNPREIAKKAVNQIGLR